MATYADILKAHGTDSLRQRVRVAVLIAAEKIRREPVSNPPTAEQKARRAWARGTFENPERSGEHMLPVVLAKTQVDAPTITLQQLTAASDEAVQAAVDDAVDVFVDVGSVA